MKFFKPNSTKDKNLSLDNPQNKKELDIIAYLNYQRNEQANTKERNIDINHLENIFTNKIYFKAMKKVPLLEKRVLYLAIYETSDLEKICKILKLSKKEVIELKNKGIKHFKENVKFYSKVFSKKGGVPND